MTKRRMGSTVFIGTAMAITMGMAGCSNATAPNTAAPNTPAPSTTTATPSPAAATGQKITLTLGLQNINGEQGISPTTGQAVPGLNTVLQQYTKDHPNIEVKTVQLAGDSATATTAKIQTTLLSNQMDIVQGATLWPFYQQGLLEDLTPYIKKDNWDANFLPSILAKPSERFWYPPYNPDATIRYNVPADMVTSTLAYDKQIFDDYGIPPLSQHPTIQEVLQVAQKMTGKDPKTGQQTYGLFFDPRTQAHLILFDLQQGVDFGVQDPQNPSKIKFNTPQIKDGIQKLIDISKYAPPGFQVGQGAENWGTEKNNVAMQLSVSPQNMLAASKNKLQNRFIVSNPLADKSGFGPYIAGNNYTIAKSSKNKDAAWDLIKFLSGPVVAKFLYDNYGTLPAWKDQNFVDPSKDPYAAAYLEASKYQRNAFFPNFMFTTFRPWMTTVISNSLSGKKDDLDSGLAQMQKQAEDWAKQQTFVAR